MRHVSELIVSLIDRVSAPSRKAAESMDRLTKLSRQNAREINRMRGQMMDAAAGAYALARAVSDPIKSAMEFESAMADVRKVVDFETPQQFKEMKNEVLAITKVLPVTASSFAALIAAAGQAGMVSDELLQFSTMAAKVGIAFDMSADETGTSLAKIKTALQMTVEETGSLSDAINHLSNMTASEAPSLIEFMKRVGTQGKTFGFTAAQTAAIGSAMIAAGYDASIAKTGFEKAGQALTKGTAATSEQRKAFKALGLDATKVAKQMQVDAVTTLEAVFTKIRALPRHMQAATISQLFGNEAKSLIPLIENADLLETSLAAVADQQLYAGSVQKEYEVRADTAANKQQLFLNKLEATSIAIGEALVPSYVRALDALSPFLDAMAQFASANPELVQGIVAVVGGLVAFRVAVIAGRFATLFMKGALLDLAIGAASTGTALLGMLNPINIIKGAFGALRIALISTGVGAIAVGLALAGVWIYNNWSGLTAFFASFGAAVMTALQPIMPVIQPIIDGAKWLADTMMSLTGTVDASESDWSSWGAAMGGVVANGITSTINAIQGMAEALSNSIQWAKELAAAVGKFYVDFWLGKVPDFLTWIKDVATTGIQTLMEIAWPHLPSWLQTLLNLAGGALSFALNIDWPEVPESIRWLASQAGGGLSAAGSKIGDGANAVKNGVGNAWNGAGDAWNNVFGGARAAGGAVAAGKTYIVNENGNELFSPRQDGYIANASDTAALLKRPAGGGLSLQIGDIHITEASNAREIAAQLAEEIQQQMSGIFADTEYGAA